MSDEVADLLESAADRLEKDGWYQGALWKKPNGRGALCTPIPDGVPVCSLGAIVAVCQVSDEALVKRQTLIDAFSLYIGDSDIGGWNDKEERTKQQVLDAFRQAAKLERL